MSELEEYESREMGKLLKIVSSNPYIEKKELQEESGLDEDVFEKAIDELVDKNLLVKMTRQSSSSMESRVPTTVYMINPEKESELDLGE
ncbi:MAG: hypothetical protein ACLFVB_10445 [Thermoplasmata archaeon]